MCLGAESGEEIRSSAAPGLDTQAAFALVVACTAVISSDGAGLRPLLLACGDS